MIGLNDSNCVLNDAPTVAALHSLLEKVLALPSAFGTAAEREVWKSYLTALPPLPQAGGVLQPYENTATFPPKPSNSVRPCESRRVLRFLGTKMLILSRQAKDNHRGNVKISLYCRRHHSSIVSTRIDSSLSGGLIVVARAAEMER
jgi:hypothetical protein